MFRRNWQFSVLLAGETKRCLRVHRPARIGVRFDAASGGGCVQSENDMIIRIPTLVVTAKVELLRTVTGCNGECKTAKRSVTKTAFQPITFFCTRYYRPVRTLKVCLPPNFLSWYQLCNFSENLLKNNFCKKIVLKILFITQN